MDDSATLLKQAWDAFYQWRRQGVVDICSQILAKEPDHSTALSLMGITYVLLEKYDLAESCISKAFTVDPPVALAYCARGYLLEVKDQKFDLARQDYDRAFRIEPGHEFIQARIAWNFHRLGRSEAGLAELERYPNSFYASFTKGQIYKETNRPDEAVKAFTKAIELQGDLFRAFYWRGRLLEEKQKYPEALANFKKALEINPDDEDSLFYRAYCLDVLGKTDEALNAYSLLLNKYSNSVAFNNRGNIYQDIDFQKAIADYDQAILLNPNYTLAWANRGNTKVLNGDIDEGIVEIKESIRINPKYVFGLERLVYAYNQKGDYPNALAAKAHLRQLSPKTRYTYDNPESQDFTGTVYSHFANTLFHTLQKNDEKFIEFWEILMMWGVGTSQIIFRGTSSDAHKGTCGAGYLVLTNKNIWIINLGDLSKRYANAAIFMKNTGFFAAITNPNITSVEKKDQIFCIPHADLQYANFKSEMILLGIGADHWELSTWFSDGKESLLAALNIARKDRVADLFKPLVAPRAPAPSTPAPTPPPPATAEEVFAKIETLKKLLDMKAIQQEDYDAKVKEMLSRL
jgi:tetratricopeptide (TPR) repeat protein